MAIGIMLTLVSGAVHGRLGDRWDRPAKLLAAAERLEGLPIAFGEWQMEAAHGLSERTVELLECAGYVHRTYVNRSTGETVNMAILLGPPGPMSVHTPDVCYSSKQFSVREQRRPVQVRATDVPDERFWSVTLRTNDLHADALRVLYAWNDGHGWSAPREPRFRYGGRPLLYKIQVAGHLLAGGVTTNDPCCAFLRDFLPVADRYLVDPTSERTSAESAKTGT